MMTAVAAQHVTLSGDIEGDYIVEDRRPDGRLSLAPAPPYPATAPKYGGRQATPEELEAFIAENDILAPDGEG